MLLTKLKINIFIQLYTQYQKPMGTANIYITSRRPDFDEKLLVSLLQRLRFLKNKFAQVPILHNRIKLFSHNLCVNHNFRGRKVIRHIE